MARHTHIYVYVNTLDKVHKNICLKEWSFYFLFLNQTIFTLMLVVANFANKEWGKKLKMTETLAYGYSSERTQCALDKSSGLGIGRVKQLLKIHNNTSNTNRFLVLLKRCCRNGRIGMACSKYFEENYIRGSSPCILHIFKIMFPSESQYQNSLTCLGYCRDESVLKKWYIHLFCGKRLEYTFYVASQRVWFY